MIVIVPRRDMISDANPCQYITMPRPYLLISRANKLSMLFENTTNYGALNKLQNRASHKSINNIFKHDSIEKLDSLGDLARSTYCSGQLWSAFLQLYTFFCFIFWRFRPFIHFCYKVKIAKKTKILPKSAPHRTVTILKRV